MTAFYFFCSNPFYKVEIFYDGSEKETLMIIGGWFFLRRRLHYAGRERKKKQPFYNKMCVTTNGDERIQGRGGLMLYFFLRVRDIFFTGSFIFFS